MRSRGLRWQALSIPLSFLMIYDFEPFLLISPKKSKSSAIKLLTLRDKNEDIHFAWVLQNVPTPRL